MYFRKTLHAQQENVDQGTLQITVRSEADNRPVENALVRISYTGDPNSVIEEVRNALYFDSSAGSWASRHKQCVAVIGGHKFYQ